MPVPQESRLARRSPPEVHDRDGTCAALRQRRVRESPPEPRSIQRFAAGASSKSQTVALWRARLRHVMAPHSRLLTTHQCPELVEPRRVSLNGRAERRVRSLSRASYDNPVDGAHARHRQGGPRHPSCGGMAQRAGLTRRVWRSRWRAPRSPHNRAFGQTLLTRAGNAPRRRLGVRDRPITWPVGLQLLGDLWLNRTHTEARSCDVGMPNEDRRESPSRAPLSVAVKRSERWMSGLLSASARAVAASSSQLFRNRRPVAATQPISIRAASAADRRGRHAAEPVLDREVNMLGSLIPRAPVVDHQRDTVGTVNRSDLPAARRDASATTDPGLGFLVAVVPCLPARQGPTRLVSSVGALARITWSYRCVAGRRMAARSGRAVASRAS